MSINKVKTDRFFNAGLKALEEKKLNTLGNIKAIAEHQKPLALSYALSELHKRNLLTSENRDALKEYSQPQDITNSLLAIASAKLATQENLNKLFALKNLEFAENAGYLFYRIPENKFSQAVFDQIIELSQQKDSIRQINHYIDQLLASHSRLFLPSAVRTSNDTTPPRLSR